MNPIHPREHACDPLASGPASMQTMEPGEAERVGGGFLFLLGPIVVFGIVAAIAAYHNS